MFFVPVNNADDSPPIVGVWPTTPQQARSYIYDLSQLAGQHEIIVDGSTTVLDPNYVAGPVLTPPLLDGGGTHIITIGAFLGPMTPGTHTVEIRGGYFGPLVEQTYDISFISFDLTYQVNVTPS